MNTDAIKSAAKMFEEHLLEDFGDDTLEVGVVAVIAEIRHTDEEGDDSTAIAFWCSDQRAWVQGGLFEAAKLSSLSSATE